MNMKNKALIFFIGMLIVTKCFSQNDSINKPTFWLRPFFENGITFLNNNFLNNSYATNSTYNWGFGLRNGNPNKNMILPYLQYSNSTYSTQNIDKFNNKVDSTLKIQEFIFGFYIPIKSINSNMLTAKIGYINSKINDDILHTSGKANGLQIGFGYEAIVFSNSRIFVIYSYDFMKLNKASFRDYDLQKISLGFIL